MCGYVTDDCSYTCTQRDGTSVRYDLSSLAEWTGGVVTAADADGAAYHWSTCRTPLPAEHLCAAPSHHKVNDTPAVTRVVANSSSGVECDVLGVQEQSYCALLDAANPTSGIGCHYYNGDGGRSFSVSFECADSPRPPTVAADPTDPLIFAATMADPHACGDGSCAPFWLGLCLPVLIGIGGGGVLLLAVLVCVLVVRARRCCACSGGGGGGGGGGCCRGCCARRAAAKSSYRRQASLDAEEQEAEAAAAAPAGAITHDDAVGATSATSTTTLLPASQIPGLAELLGACGLSDRLPIAANWCIEQGWESVAHFRHAGPQAVDALVATLRLKPPKAKKLRKELARDAWAWDSHAAAARGRGHGV